MRVRRSVRPAPEGALAKENDAVPLHITNLLSHGQGLLEHLGSHYIAPVLGCWFNANVREGPTRR